MRTIERPTAAIMSTPRLTTGVDSLVQRVISDMVLLKADAARYALVFGAMIALLPFSSRSMGWAWLPALVLALLLAMLIVIDLAVMRLPDWLTLPLALLGIAVAALGQDDSWGERCAAVLVGYGTLVLVAELYRRLRGRDGLGRGDAKLFAAAGAWVGLAGLPVVLLIASTTAIAVVGARWHRDGMTGNSRLALGPYLALGIWIVWLFGISS